jgi:hypothetical protein
MLRVSNDFGVVFFREISRVALRFKITERIEYHDLASRKCAAWNLTISMRERWPLHRKAISKLHIITCQPRNVMRKDIARRTDIRYVVSLGHPSTWRRNIILLWVFIVCMMATHFSVLALDATVTPEQRALLIQQSGLHP